MSSTHSNKKSRKSTRIAKAKLKEDSCLAAEFFKTITERTDEFEEIIPELGNAKSSKITCNTLDYQGKQLSILNDFVSYLESSNIYKDKMDLVDFTCKGGKKIKAPLLFVACSCDEGRISDEKINLANQMLIDYVKQMKMKRKGKSGMDYQPHSQTVMIRTLLSMMKEKYSWNFTMKSFHFKGGVSMILSSLFQARLKKDKTNTVILFLI